MPRLNTTAGSACAVGAALLLAICQAAQAQEAQPSQTRPAPRVLAARDQELSDQRIVDAAFADFNKGGFEALQSDLAALQAVLDRAPAAYPRIERLGHEVRIHANDNAEYLSMSLLVAANAEHSRKGERGSTVVRAPNPYPLAALLLGSYANEAHHSEQALSMLDRGLTTQPGNLGLMRERLAALMALGRLQEVIAACDQVINSSDLFTAAGRSHFLRQKGVALIDLHRWDEAEAALKASIDADPNDQLGVEGARRELLYLSNVRAGAPAVGITLKSRRQEEQERASPPARRPQPQEPSTPT